MYPLKLFKIRIPNFKKTHTLIEICNAFGLNYLFQDNLLFMAGQFKVCLVHTVDRKPLFKAHF